MRGTISAAVCAALLAVAGCSNEDDGGDLYAVIVPAVDGADVVAAVEAAGLPVLNPRDNTQEAVDSGLNVVEMLTTDTFSVRVWATVEDAQHWVEFGSADPPILLGDQTTVDLHEGGTTPPYDRLALDAAVRQATDSSGPVLRRLPV